jgi:hypothetical protein
LQYVTAEETDVTVPQEFVEHLRELHADPKIVAAAQQAADETTRRHAASDQVV